jgi:hypothetical protein
MQPGQLFRIKADGPVYKVEEQEFMGREGCANCAGDGNSSLCQKFPYCLPKGKQHVFRRLSAYEVRKAQKKGTTIKKITENE